MFTACLIKLFRLAKQVFTGGNNPAAGWSSMFSPLFVLLMALVYPGCGSEYEILLEKNTVPVISYPGFPTQSPVIYWCGTDKIIKRIYTDGTGEKEVILADGTPLDIDIDINNNRIFWIEKTGVAYHIKKANLDGSDIMTVFSSINGPTSIGIDNTNQIIYWNNNSIPALYRSAVTADTLTETLWFNGLARDHVYSTCIDGVNGKVYFTTDSYYSNSMVLGSGNSGDVYQGSTTISTSFSQDISLTGPAADSSPLKGIAVDAAGGHVFYATNTSHGTWPKNITRTDLNLAGIETWIYLGVTDIHKISLDLTNRKIYWTSQTDNMIYRADLDSADSNLEPFLSLDSMPIGLCISQ